MLDHPIFSKSNSPSQAIKISKVSNLDMNELLQMGNVVKKTAKAVDESVDSSQM